MLLSNSRSRFHLLYVVPAGCFEYAIHNRVQECRDAYSKLNGMMQFGSKLKLSPLDIEGEL